MLVLEEIYKSKKAENTEQFNLRIHRGLSWLKKAALLDDELDLKFISLWIGFNAIHTQETGATQDKQILKSFLQKVFHLDQEHKIYNLIWGKLNHHIQLLVKNPYFFQIFWDYQNQKISQKHWKETFEIEKKYLHQTLQARDSVTLLLTIFNCLYTLYNQIIHGGSTYNSSLNRKQLQDGCRILSMLLPIFIHILLDYSKDLDFKKPFYPVVQVC